MPSKILLADDSMTAQKMGKEILTGAGYEVTAVSNGAAAAKKLVDKFDVIILDINMPGYTGFELCEKIRANMESAKTPVLLTCGKMEHYEPKDVQRVKADGVIIKPFEATDLLATVQKMIEKAAPAEPAYEKTLIMQRPKVEDFKDDSYNQWKEAEAEEPEAPKKQTIDMSHADASAPAFGMDMEEHLAPAPAPEPAAPPAPAFQAAAFETPAAAAPAFEVPSTPLTSVESSSIESLMQPPPPPMMMEEVAAPIPVAPAAFSAPPPIVEPSFSAPAASGRDPMFESPANEAGGGIKIPVKDPALAAHVEINSPEFVAKNATETAAATAPNADAEFEARVAAAMSTGYEDAHEMVEPEPEEVHAEPIQEIHEAAPTIQAAPQSSASMPGMMAEPPEYERTMKITPPPDLEISGQFSPSAGEVEITPDPMIERLSDRVEAAAATMQVTSSPAPVMEAAPAVEAPAPEIEHHDAALVEQMQAAVAEMPVEPHVEELAPEPEAPTMVAEVAPPPPPAATNTGHDLELANALAAAVGAEAPSAMAASATASVKPNITVADPNVIAAAVHRAMAKMMPAIMTEVAKELDPEKK